MNTENVISPFVAAEAYRVGQVDGFKAGLAVGVGAVILVKAAWKNHKRRNEFKVRKNTK